MRRAHTYMGNDKHGLHQITVFQRVKRLGRWNQHIEFDAAIGTGPKCGRSGDSSVVANTK